MRFATTVAALAAAASASNTQENQISLKSWDIFTESFGGIDNFLGLSLNADVGIFYKFPVNIKWGKEFQLAQEVVTYAGGNFGIDIVLFDFFVLSLKFAIHPIWVQLIRNDFYILWPKDSVLSKVPEDADMEGYSDDEMANNTAKTEEYDMGDDWWCMDTIYGYELARLKVKGHVAFKGCDWSIYDQFSSDPNWDCSYSTYYFNKIY